MADALGVPSACYGVSRNSNPLYSFIFFSSPFIFAPTFSSPSRPSFSCMSLLSSLLRFLLFFHSLSFHYSFHVPFRLLPMSFHEGVDGEYGMLPVFQRQSALHTVASSFINCVRRDAVGAVYVRAASVRGYTSAGHGSCAGQWHQTAAAYHLHHRRLHDHGQMYAPTNESRLFRLKIL